MFSRRRDICLVGVMVAVMGLLLTGCGIFGGGGEPKVRTLELTFAQDVNPAELIGTTFDLFDWEGVALSGEFDDVVTAAGAVWDTDNLYATGQITLIPEPATLTLLVIAAVVLLYYGRGPVQGFGVTLAIGIVSSVFCALIVTRLFVDLVLARGAGTLRV